MEAISNVVSIILSNFWPIFCIIALLMFRRDWGLILLVYQTVFGYSQLAYFFFGFIALFDIDNTFFHPGRWGSKSSNKKDKVYIDPDYD